MFGVRATFRRSERSILYQFQRVWLSSAASPSPTTQPLVLYQYAICPFCHQAKAFLDYYQTPYKTIEVNPLTKAEIRQFRDPPHNYRQVPIAAVTTNTTKQEDDTSSSPLLGSDVIIQHILAAAGERTTTKDNNGDDDDKWIQFARKELAVLLYPNLCRTLAGSYAAFGYVQDVPTFSWWQRLSVQTIGSVAMYFAASRVKKKYDITDEQAALDAAIDKLDTALEGSSSGYLSPVSSPGSGDLLVFGTLRSLEQASPTLLHAKIMANRSATSQWYQRMTEQVNLKKSV